MTLCFGCDFLCFLPSQVNRGPAAGDESVDDRLQSPLYKQHLQAMAAALVPLVGPPGFAKGLEKPADSPSEPGEGGAAADFGFRRIEPELRRAAGGAQAAAQASAGAASATAAERALQAKRQARAVIEHAVFFLLGSEDGS